MRIIIAVVVLLSGCGFKHQTPGHCMAIWPAKCEE